MDEIARDIDVGRIGERGKRESKKTPPTALKANIEAKSDNAACKDLNPRKKKEEINAVKTSGEFTAKYATVSVGKTKVPKKKSQMVLKLIAKRSSSTAKKHGLRKGSDKHLGVHIPGTRVYARWWDESDPVAHGTWYPRIVFSVKLAPVQDGSRFHRSSKTPPRLLHHIKFDDGAESLEIEDVHVTSSKRYAKLLEEALERTALPTSVVPMKRLDNGTGLFARFFDETDLNMHVS